MTTNALAQTCAATIHERFRDYQDRFRRITQHAPERFINRQWEQIRSDTTLRLNLYSTVVDQTETDILERLRDRILEQKIWTAAKAAYAIRIADRDDGELAETFFNSVTRRIFSTVGVNRRIEFVHDDHAPPLTDRTEPVFSTYPLAGDIGPVIRQIIADYKDLRMDQTALEQSVAQMAARIEKRLDDIDAPSQQDRIEMVHPVFYRGQGAFLIGRMVTEKRIVPLTASEIKKFLASGWNKQVG